MNAASLLGVCVTGALQSALLVLAVGTILLACRRADATTRHRVWFLTLVATIALPVVDLIVRAAPAPHAAVAASNTATVAAHALAAFVLSPRVVEIVLALWALVSGVFLARLAWSFVRLERLRRATRPVSRELEARVQRWARRLGITRHVAVRTSDELASPIAIGLLEPSIVMPRQLLATLGEDDIEYIFVHELAHLRRHDDVTNLLAKVARAIFIFNPILLFIERKMALEREIACDDWVVATLGKARRYARCLAHVLLLSPPHAPAHGLPFFRSAEHSVQRIEMLLAPQPPARLFLVNSALVGALSTIMLGMGVAASAPQIVAFDLPLARVLGVAQLETLRAQVLDPAATALATAAPRIDRALVTALDRGSISASYSGVNLVPIRVAHAALAPLALRSVRLTAETPRSIDAQPARAAVVEEAASAAGDFETAAVPQSSRTVATTRFSTGSPITPPRIPALALSYNSFVLAPATVGGAGTAIATTAAGGSSGGGAGSSGTGSLGGLNLGGGGVGAPSSGGHARSDIPVQRRSGGP